MNLLSLRKRLFREQRSPAAGSGPRISPLDLPELLEHILFFVHLKTLSTTVRLVCKQWNLTSQKLFPPTFVWYLDMASNPNQQERFQQMWPRISRLECRTENVHVQFLEEDTEQIRRAMESKIMNQKRGCSGVEPLRELTLDLPFVAPQRLQTLWSCFKSLTVLNLESNGYHVNRLELDPLYCSCPDLVSFSLSSPHPPIHVYGGATGCHLSPPATENVDTPAVQQWSLQSLTLKNVVIPESVLLSLLEASAPVLTELNLVDIRLTPLHSYLDHNTIAPKPVMDYAGFVDYLLAMRSSLRVLHLSMANQTITERGLSALMDNFQSKVKDWGLWVGDTQFLVNIPNRITHLTLTTSTDKITYSEDGLHRFLCESPHLLHLKAAAVRYNVRFMDLSNLTNPSCGRSGVSEEEERHRVSLWACKGLLTLHLSFRTNEVGWQMTHVHSRVIFGYLVRVCPSLRTFETDATFQMDLSLQSGFCLLARLEWLKTLSVRWNDGRMNVEMCDVDWMRFGDGGGAGKLWNRMQVRQLRNSWQGELSEEKARIPAKEELLTQEQISEWKNRKEEEQEEEARKNKKNVASIQDKLAGCSWMDVRYIGSLTDVDMVLEDLSQGVLKCWPRLEGLYVYRSGVYRCPLISLLQKVRPGQVHRGQIKKVVM